MINSVLTLFGTPVEIQVTREDRDAEVPHDPGKNLIARAMTRALKRPVEVNYNRWCFATRWPRDWRKLPRSARRAVSDFRNHGDFEPFRFRVLL